MNLSDEELIDNNKVMSTLLTLEENSRQLFDFYGIRPNSDGFRCKSVYKTYNLFESEDFKDAIELYNTIKQNMKA